MTLSSNFALKRGGGGRNNEGGVTTREYGICICVPSCIVLISYISPRGVTSDLLYTARWLQKPSAFWHVFTLPRDTGAPGFTMEECHISSGECHVSSGECHVLSFEILHSPLEILYCSNG